ncbi:MAG TPA: hypothetical protein VMV95_03210 [Bacillota bacterium]|nr:hypothetical protein [Bacillota bacterium]
MPKKESSKKGYMTLFRGYVKDREFMYAKRLYEKLGKEDKKLADKFCYEYALNELKNLEGRPRGWRNAANIIGGVENKELANKIYKKAAEDAFKKGYFSYVDEFAKKSGNKRLINELCSKYTDSLEEYKEALNDQFKVGLLLEEAWKKPVERIMGKKNLRKKLEAQAKSKKKK